MSLVDRIAQIQAETATRELAVKQEAQRKLDEDETSQLQTQALVAKQETDRKATIIADLSPLMEFIKTRKQLEIVRDQVWQVGGVEESPTSRCSRGNTQYMNAYYSEANPGLVLRLLAHYRTVESDEIEDGGLHIEDDNVFICVGVAKNPPTVSLRSGLSEDHPVRVGGRYYESADIPLGQSQKAYDLLEAMLAKACVKLGPVQAFLRHQEEALRQYGFNQTPELTPSLRLPWYRRIFG